MNITAIFCILFSYLLGAVPFGLLLSRRSGIDIRTEGSRNIGATNVARLLGKKLGAMTLVLDVLKGYLPMFVASILVQGDPHQRPDHCLVRRGHGFGPYVSGLPPLQGRQRSGHRLGAFLYLAPPAVLGCLMVFLATVGLSGFVSLGSLLGSASMLLWLSLLKAPAWTTVAGRFYCPDDLDQACHQNIPVC
jgi:acyl phosphate:glycerol-3-phosphate acyltransferase